MDSANTITPTHLLETARTIPIADLCPDLSDPNTKAVSGVVTITWPYNKVKGTFAFNLAEPDFRLRRNKGQVRINFTGRAAKAVGDSGLGGNDEILLSLRGAAWEAEEVDRRRSLPGADLGWRLVYSQSLMLRIKRAETNETEAVIVDERSDDVLDEHPDGHPIASDLDPVQSTAAVESSYPIAPLSPIHRTPTTQGVNTNKFNDSEFASPAFVKRARMSYGALFEDGFDIFQEEDNSEKKGRTHTRFGRYSSSWRYTSRSPSPEPAATPPKNVDEQVSSPTRPAHSPAKARMADEGCRTVEMDLPSPQPRSTALETHVGRMVSSGTVMEDAPTDDPEDSTRSQKTQTHHSDLSSGPSSLNAPSPNYINVPPTEPEAPSPQSEQQPSSGYTFASNPWTMGVAPPAFEPQQHLAPSFSHEPFASPGVGDAMPGNQANPFIGVQGPVEHGIVYSTEQNPPSIDYPPHDPDEDTTPQADHDEALTNYPAAYLEDGHMTQNGQEVAEESSQYPDVAELGSGSWATINHSSKATAAAPTDRLGRRDGSTPEQAFVIEESDAGSESEPEPMAVEDTVDNGRAYALRMYEDVDAEDEVDAQYSDDDEPEYDADEMGGDYDTRNYEKPGDDDEGSPDEDLQPQPLETEFDDGANWDEEEQQEFLDEENEGEYEMDEDMPAPGPQPAVRANPMVIDLISSSEDESEDENEDDGGHTSTNNERFSTHIVSRVEPSHQQTNFEGDSPQVGFGDEEAEIVSQASMSEADDSSAVDQDGHEYTSVHEEDEEEEQHKADDSEDDKKNEERNESIMGGESELELREAEGIPEYEGPENQGKQPIDSDLESEHETKSESDALRGDTLGQMIPYHQVLAKEIPEEDPVRLSAADGLEMLSQTVNEESNAYSQPPAADLFVENMDNKQPPTESRDEIDNVLRDLPLDTDGTQGKISPQEHDERRANSKQVEADMPLASTTNETEFTAATPSSPPLTQSFRSNAEDIISTIERRTVASTVEQATAQLPTPSNTQVTDITLNASITTSTNVAQSFDSVTTVEHSNYQLMEGSIDQKPANDLVQQDDDVDMDEDAVQKQLEGAFILELQEQQPSSESSATSSPARSFQSQVDDIELALPDSVEEAYDGPQMPRSVSPESGSLVSHMEVDEELQASILEDSPLEDHPDLDDRDGEDEKLQASILEDVHLEDHPGQDGQNDQDDEDEQLQASILEDSYWQDDLAPDSRNDEDGSYELDISAANIDADEGNQAEIVPSVYEETPAKQLAEDISAQLKRNFSANSGSSEEDSDISIRNDPSVHLARVANSSKKRKRKRAASTDSYRPSKRLFDSYRSRTPETDDSSILLARASFASHTPRSEEDSYSMTAAKLQLARHLRDELPDCTSLKVLRQHLTKSLDVIAVAVMQPPEPRRAKGGPREFMMSFTVADHSIGPYAVAEALIYRPHKDTLPVVRYGDIVLLRNFTVVSLANKGFGLRSSESSSWAVFDYEGEPPEIRGPPVEYGTREALYVSYLREWFRLLDVKAREKLELANQKIINARKGKSNYDETMSSTAGN